VAVTTKELSLLEEMLVRFKYVKSLQYTEAVPDNQKDIRPMKYNFNNQRLLTPQHSCNKSLSLLQWKTVNAVTEHNCRCNRRLFCRCNRRLLQLQQKALLSLQQKTLTAAIEHSFVAATEDSYRCNRRLFYRCNRRLLPLQ